MWIQRLLRVFSFNLLPHVEEKMEEQWSPSSSDDGGEVDWLSERPENWYQGPLDLSYSFEEGVEELQTLQKKEEKVKTVLFDTFELHK